MSQEADPAALTRARYADPGLREPTHWNPVLASLLSHRSIRAYRPDPLPPGVLDVGIAAAQSAASSSNLQLWSVVAVADPDRRARLAALAGNQKHIVQAPLLLVWLADLSRAERLAKAQDLPVEGLDYLETLVVGIVDAALAAQNSVAAFESLGLGTVYIGAIRNRPAEVAAELNLPKHILPVFGLVVGYPDADFVTEVKPRLPQQTVLHLETYDTTAEPGAIAAYDERVRTFQRRQSLPEQNWSHQVANRLRGPAALNGREKLRAALGGFGFELR